MHDSDTKDLLDRKLIEWIEDVAGAPVSRIDRVPGGASRRSYFLGIGPDAASILFLRMDCGDGPMSGTVFTLGREAALLRALEDSEVRTPSVHGYSEAWDAMLLDRVPGSSDYNGLTDPAAREAIERKLIFQLAALHRQPFDFEAVLGGPALATIEQAVRADLAVWREQYETRTAAAVPAIEFALDWLERDVPDGKMPPALIHGDIGPGNFLFESGEVTSLIDWELAHAGHPLEDVACIIARALGVPFGNPETLVANYTEASGQPVNRDALLYCVILVLTRFSIGIQMALANCEPHLDIPMLLKFRQVNLHALLRLLAEAEGVDAAAADPPDLSSGDEMDSLYRYAIAVARELAGEMTDPYSAHRTRGIGELLSYLRAVSVHGSERLRAQTPSGEDRAAFAIKLAALDGEGRATLLAELVARSHLQHVLMRDALGPMFVRSITLP